MSCLRQAVDETTEESDRDLLRRFVNDRDEAAFAAIFRRHSRMVLGVGFRVLRSREQAEDVCQATFLLLAKRARQPGWRASLANWLYTVAYNLSLSARATERRRASRAANLPPKPDPNAHTDVSVRELQGVLDAEIARLPGKYRCVVVLCCLEGYTRDETARALGAPVAAIKQRLEEGRARLRTQLARRGFELSLALAAFTLSAAAGAAGPSKTCARDLARAAIGLTAGGRIEDLTGPTVSTLYDQGAHVMLLSKTRIAVAVVIAACSVVASVTSSASRSEVRAGEAALLASPSAAEQRVNGGPNVAEPVKVDRTIGKEPVYRTKNPKYGLLVFGPEQRDKVWFVVDGETLYVDRKGDGDLTGPDKRVEANKKSKYAGETEGYTFEVGEVTAGGRVHKGLVVTTTPLIAYGNTHVQRRPDVRTALEKDPKVQVVTLTIDVDVPGIKGGGLGGRLTYIAGFLDTTGVLVLADKPANAPVVCLGGPLQVTLYERPTVRAGSSSEFVLAVGTPGWGPGTFAMLTYDKTIPKDARAVVQATYAPPAPGEPAVTEKHVLMDRCCMFNLYDTVHIPETARPETADFRITLEGWEAGKVAGTTHHLTVLPRSDRVVEPASANIVARLSNPQSPAERRATFANLKFSGDGKRLFSMAYPTGVVQVWDLDGMKEARRIETPPGARGSMAYAAFSPDDRLVYVPTEARTIIDSEKDGQKTRRVVYEGSVRVWDLGTGEEKPTLTQPPDHSASTVQLSPDGRLLVCNEMLGSAAGEPRRYATSVWDLKARERKQLTNEFCLTAVSPDGKVVAAQSSNVSAGTSVLRLFEAGTFRETASRSCPDPDRSFHLNAYSPDGSALTVFLVDKKNNVREICFLDGKTLEDRGRYVVEGDRDGRVGGVFTPDGKRYVILTANKKCAVWDMAAKKVVRTFDVEGENWLPTVSPDGRWLAVGSLQRRTGDEVRSEDPNDHPQPRLTVYDLTGDSPPRTMVAPPGFVGGIQFSPDSKTIAFGTTGGILLFDRTKP